MTFNPFEITVISFSIAFFILAVVSRVSGWEYLGKKFSTLIIPRVEKFKNVFQTLKRCCTMLINADVVRFSALVVLAAWLICFYQWQKHPFIQHQQDNRS